MSVKMEIEIPDSIAMELNAHISNFKHRMGVDVTPADMILSCITGYLIDHANDIEDYRIAHEAPLFAHKSACPWCGQESHPERRCNY